MVETVNVAIIGDEGSGKTSLVLSGAQRAFRPGDAVPVLPTTAFRVKLANEECNCVCRDSSSRNMEDVKKNVRECDVVLICFNMAGRTSLHSAIHVWLPRVTEINREVPIIMVGCKEDQAVITQTQIAVRLLRSGQRLFVSCMVAHSIIILCGSYASVHGATSLQIAANIRLTCAAAGHHSERGSQSHSV